MSKMMNPMLKKYTNEDADDDDSENNKFWRL